MQTYLVTVANLDQAIISVEANGVINPAQQDNFPQYEVIAENEYEAIDKVISMRAKSGSPVENWIEL